MGRVLQKAILKNTNDLHNVIKGYIDNSKVHEIEVEFLVDTGATLICLPPDLIKALDLQLLGERKARTATGHVKRKMYSPVQISIFGREADFNVMEVSEGISPLLGYIPLQALDLVVNPVKERLEGNPEHGGEYLLYQL